MYGKYMLTTRIDIVFVLRTMLKHGAMATVYFDKGSSFFLSTLLAIDDEAGSLVLDAAGDAEINRAAATTSRLIVTSSQDGVKIQFLLGKLQPFNHEGRPAFRAELPERLLRLQRREYFRLEAPVANPMLCQVPLPDAGGSRIDLPLLDLSGGGIGLMAEREMAGHFPVDAEFPDCRFELPAEGVISSTLRIRSAYPVTTRGGHAFVRLGCEFVGLSGSRLTMIQRYITRIERERKARLSGLE